MPTSNLLTSWKQHFASLTGNDDGDQTMLAFSLALAAEQEPKEKLREIVNEVDSMLLVANKRKEITILHSISDLGGTRSRPDNKVVCLMGAGPRATCVMLDWRQAVADCNLTTPSFDEIENCPEEDLETLEVTAEPAQVTYPGSSAFIPAPWLRDTIFASESKNPAEIIKLVIASYTNSSDRTAAHAWSFNTPSSSYPSVTKSSSRLGPGPKTRARPHTRSTQS